MSNKSTANNKSNIAVQSNIVKEYKYESEKYLFGSNFSELYSKQIRKESTPSWIVEDMIDLLPDSVWHTNTKFLDIYCKSGIFLEVIIDRLMNRVDYSAIDLYEPKDIYKYIIENQVYALCWTKEYADLTRTAINGKVFIEKSIKLLERDRNYITDKEFRTKFREIFGDMKIDVVVANPPYNSDIYIPFVELGHQLAANCSVFITPAKWQAKGGEKNDQFRQNIVPYMSKIVYYPMASDVFNIAEPGGIAYYMIDKTKTYEKEHTIICNNSEFAECKHKSQSKYLYNEIINDIINKTKNISIINKLCTRENSLSFLRQYYLHESYKVSNTTKSDTNDICVMSGNNIKGYCSKKELYTDCNIDKYKVITPVMLSAGVWANIPNYGISPLSKLKNNQVPIGSYPIIAFFDTEDECDNFLSYCNTKLVKFLHYLGVNGTTETADFWRFVPDPGAFDHIFTDDELYKKYNLTKEEINIIESVIKERK